MAHGGEGGQRILDGVKVAPVVAPGVRGVLVK
jgi:hypothetical protein